MEGLVKITVDNGEHGKLELHISEEADIFEWANHIRTILKWLTFNDSVINEILKSEDEIEGEGE